jgi:hypothetical protein
MYEDVHQPREFVGFLGFIIRSLNVVRYSIELLVQRLVLKYQVRQKVQPALRKEIEGSLVEKFWLDDQKEKIILVEQGVISTQEAVPSASVLALELQVAQPKLRPKNIEHLSTVYGQKSRAKKYGLPPLEFDDFEPVGKTNESNQ